MEKVSIISPVYNGESYIERFLESILAQTYKNIELIIIDDGSLDKTAEIINGYKERFLNANIEFITIKQKNKGAAAALNKGLKIFTGDYLTWPDSDDFLTPDSIECKVNYLKNTKYSIVRSNGYIVNEGHVDKIIRKKNLRKKNKVITNIFEQFLLETISFSNGGYFLVETKKFKECNPHCQIFESNAGQNWQMLLPVLYKNICGYIDDPLYYYVVRQNSHSRQEKSYEQLIQKSANHKEILVNTIDSMNLTEEEKIMYYQLIKMKYIKKNMQISRKFNKTKEFLEYYGQIKSNKSSVDFNLLDYIYYFIKRHQK